MKRFAIYMFMALAALLPAGCSQEEIAPLSGPDDGSGDSFTVTVGIAVPQMEAASRGIPGDNPGNGLKLTLLEFSKGGDAASSFLTHVYEAETLTPTNVANGGIVKFKVTLVKTQEPRVLHLMVSDNFVSPGYGSEASLLPAIAVNGAQEAYWGRVVFDNGYATAPDADGKQNLLPEVVTKLTDVPVIRNFAKISVTTTASNFELYGFELVNVPTSGTIAPFNTETSQIPQLLAAGGSMVSYAEAHAGYQGVLPPDITFANTADVAKKWDTAEDTDQPLNRSRPRYIYEHPFESTRRTYMIVKGRYNSGAPTYYKVDLGNIGEDSSFKFYDLLRNYNYNVIINKVTAEGAATVADAINGHVSNNLSASVETSAMPQVSDGDNMLMVNTTSHIITYVGQQVEIRYQYIKNINNASAKVVDNSAVTVTGKDTSNDVISSFTETDEGDWHVIKITPNEPDITDKRHTIRITDGKGLERVITLLLRMPYEFASEADVYAGANNNRPTNATKGVVPKEAGKELTVYFDLPDGIPESVFPLQFRLEADNQNVENNPTGTLVVWTGPSLFNAGKPSISYIKTVTYQEYLHKYKADTSSELDINTTNTNHTIRCRLRTINQYSGSDTETTKIRINNPSFKDDAIATFTRSNSSS